VERLPKDEQIRVFNAEDMALAQAVRDSLAANGFAFTIQDLSTRYDVKPGILEFWFASPG
jgi:spore coat polysaccharide biosynthesis protein SpsF (cytidylyltransferase family)